MTGPSTLALSAGRLSLVLAPSMGGSIARFDHESGDGRCTPVLRGTQGTPDDILAYANFPLVPFVNRIRDGRFVFRGREVRLAPNLPGDPSPLHGQGWLAPWRVERCSAAEAELAFDHEPGEWPWAYAARQVFALDEGGLTLTISCTNTSDTPMPCGLGCHPYFPCTEETVLDTGVECVWTIDEKVLPVEKVPAEGRFDLRARKVCRQDLDHGFSGWSGRARIEDPSLPFAIEMSSGDARFFQLYSPTAHPIFVAEPVTHANAALNAPEEQWDELGLRVLAPGESMALTMRIDVLPR
ncbi:MAG: aldose 1-epimerase [Allosphingosinicella sp.]